MMRGDSGWKSKLSLSMLTKLTDALTLTLVGQDDAPPSTHCDARSFRMFTSSSAPTA